MIRKYILETQIPLLKKYETLEKISNLDGAVAFYLVPLPETKI